MPDGVRLIGVSETIRRGDIPVEELLDAAEAGPEALGQAWDRFLESGEVVRHVEARIDDDHMRKS